MIWQSKFNSVSVWEPALINESVTSFIKWLNDYGEEPKSNGDESLQEGEGLTDKLVYLILKLSETVVTSIVTVRICSSRI